MSGYVFRRCICKKSEPKWDEMDEDEVETGQVENKTRSKDTLSKKGKQNLPDS